MLQEIPTEEVHKDCFASIWVSQLIDGRLRMVHREINFKLLVPGAEITEVEGISLQEKHGFTLSINPAHHTER